MVSIVVNSITLFIKNVYTIEREQKKSTVFKTNERKTKGKTTILPTRIDGNFMFQLYAVRLFRTRFDRMQMF